MIVLYGTPATPDVVEISAVIDVNTSPNSVAEDAAVGTAVGITAHASHEGYSIAYSLSDDSGGLFSIGATGVVTTAGALDYNTASSHSITVLATSSDGVSTASQTFTVAVTESFFSVYMDGEEITLDGEPVDLQ